MIVNATKCIVTRIFSNLSLVWSYKLPDVRDPLYAVTYDEDDCKDYVDVGQLDVLSMNNLVINSIRRMKGLNLEMIS